MDEFLRVLILLALITHAFSSVTIKSSSGDIFECVDIYQQRAFNHELLKNHKIQEWPSSIPRTTEIKRSSIRQTWEAKVNTVNCSKGTIPQRKDNITRSNYNGHTPVHEHAVMMMEQKPPELYGAKATINVWDPKVEKGDELSISQIWLASGKYEDKNLQTIEVGWQVLPNMYEDNQPRLFIFWTSDTYATGCYNLQCPGFVQINSDILLGGAIFPISAFEGSQYEITVSVWKDKKSANWWLSLGPNNLLVGYWPAEIFKSLAYVDDVQWGGEVMDSHSFGRHTTTQMGSGHFPDEGFGKSSYFRNLEIVDNNNSFQPIQKVTTKATNSEFYRIEKGYQYDWGTYFFYGGRGFSHTHSGVVSLASSSFFFYFSLIICFII